MGNTKNILVSGASGIVGYGILKSLRIPDYPLHLIAMTTHEESAAQNFCDTLIKAIPTSDPNYLDWLCNIINEYNIDLLIPGIEIDMYLWAQNISYIEKTGAKVLLNKIDLLKLCEDKWHFYENLNSYNTEYCIASSLEKTYETLKQTFGLPFLLKPRKGYGSRGVVIVENEKTFDQYKESIGSSLMAQTIVGTVNDEYTISAFCGEDGEVCASMTLRRKLSHDGYTEKAEVVQNNTKITNAVRRLSSIFKPIGPTNFQVRIHDGVVKLLEINPRISSSTSIRSAFGYNEALMACQFFLHNQKPVQPVIREGKAIRYVEDIIYYK